MLWLQSLFEGPLVPFWAGLGGGFLTLLSIWWKIKLERSRPRAEIRLSEMEFVTKTDREFKVWVMQELSKCMETNGILRTENVSKDKTIIDLTRQVAVLELDATRRGMERKTV